MNDGLIGLMGRIGGLVKSVQQGSITFPSVGVTSATATISAVNPNRTVIVPAGYTTYDNDLTRGSPRLSLTNATTVTANVAVGGGGVGEVVVNFFVVEFY